MSALVAGATEVDRLNLFEIATPRVSTNTAAFTLESPGSVDYRCDLAGADATPRDSSIVVIEVGAAAHSSS